MLASIFLVLLLLLVPTRSSITLTDHAAFGDLQACDDWEGAQTRKMCHYKGSVNHIQSVETDLRLVVDQISSASGFGALQPEPAAGPVLPAVVLLVHQPKQILSQLH